MVFCLALPMLTQALAQTPLSRRLVDEGAGRGRRASAVFPDRPPADPAALERGKALYGVHCNFCHNSDARGGEGGPNLLRSDIVLNDQKREKIAPAVQNGRLDAGMPKFDLTMVQATIKQARDRIPSGPDQPSPDSGSLCPGNTNSDPDRRCLASRSCRRDAHCLRIRPRICAGLAFARRCVPAPL